MPYFERSDKKLQKMRDKILQGIIASKVPQERERLLNEHRQFLRDQAQRAKTA